MEKTQRNLYRMKQLVPLLSISKSTIYGWIRDDKFPKGKKLNGTTVWKAETIDNWIEENAGDSSYETDNTSN
jgi:predicted DNA-binding transcriptional regulator AlpA